MKKRKVIVIAAGLVLLLIVIFAYRSFAKPAAQIQQTRNARVVLGSVRPTVTATGNISAASQTMVNFENGGKLIEVNIKPGDVVEIGAQLGKIDPYELGRQVDQAKAGLESAEIRRDQALANADANIRSNELSVDSAKRVLDSAQAELDDLKAAGAAQERVDEAQGRLDQANTAYQQALIKLQSARDSRNYDARLQEIQVSQARQALDDAYKQLNAQVLVSPVAGTVISVNYSVGDQVPGTNSGISSAGTASSRGGGTGTDASTGGSGSTASGGTAFAVIGDPSRMQATLTIDQSDVDDVKAGMPVIIEVDAVPDKVFKGKITSIDPTPVSSQGVTTYTAYASIEKPSASLMQGMSVTAKIDQGARKNVLVVPNLAVRAAKGGKVVRKMVDGQPTDVSVMTGASDEEYTEIKSGLTQGDLVIIDVFDGSSSGAQAISQQRSGGSMFPGMTGGGFRTRGGF